MEVGSFTCTVLASCLSSEIFNYEFSLWTCLMKVLHENSNASLSNPLLKTLMMVAITVGWDSCCNSFLSEWTDNPNRPTVIFQDFRTRHRPLQFHFHSPPVLFDLLDSRSQLFQGSKVDNCQFELWILHQLMYEFILKGSILGGSLTLYPECLYSLLIFGGFIPICIVTSFCNS
ncbi:hypothetical protein ACHQM5_027948 [Ranunculus cassubicifolius]